MCFRLICSVCKMCFSSASPSCPKAAWTYPFLWPLSKLVIPVFIVCFPSRELRVPKPSSPEYTFPEAGRAEADHGKFYNQAPYKGPGSASRASENRVDHLLLSIKSTDFSLGNFRKLGAEKYNPYQRLVYSHFSRFVLRI